MENIFFLVIIHLKIWIQAHVFVSILRNISKYRYNYPNLPVYVVVSCCTQTLCHSCPRKLGFTRPLATRHHGHDATCNIMFMHILLRMVFQQFILYVFLPNRIPPCTFVIIYTTINRCCCEVWIVGIRYKLYFVKDPPLVRSNMNAKNHRVCT